MVITKVKIHNFKRFQGDFTIDLAPDMNILVGNNEAGKSTVLEAIQLALTGYYHGRNIRTELSQYLFNKTAVDEYLDSLAHGRPIDLPSIHIEIYFSEESDDGAMFNGNGNREGEKARGFRFSIEFDEDYKEEYQALIDGCKDIKSLPIEYYQPIWTTFARKPITTKLIPVKAAVIDSANYRFQNGSDVHVARIVRDKLSAAEVAAIAQAHRRMKEAFMGDEAIVSINDKISSGTNIQSGRMSLTVNLGTKDAWETSLLTQLGETPFDYLGKGTQSLVKTELALSRTLARTSQIIMLEEPENHLSFSKLSFLVAEIESKCQNVQVLITTHSSFVANKLGLEHLHLLANNKIVRLKDLDTATLRFFKKVAGYETLRLLLCRKAILVEGPSDELIVQRAYMKYHSGKLPIQGEVDVISVGTAFLRYLEIAKALRLPTAVVTDNDGDVTQLKKKYAQYISDDNMDFIQICYDDQVDNSSTIIGEEQSDSVQFNYNTLEPKLFKANGGNIKLFSSILHKDFKDSTELLRYMSEHKTKCSLAFFETEEEFAFPPYIMKAVKDEQ